MRKLLKKFVSTNTRRRLAFGLVRARRPTARWRPLPNLLVIGAQRCGTSSLFKYLGGHPQCHASVRKEIRYFTEFYSEGVNWYKAHFPLKTVGPSRVIFEATPDYLLDSRVPQRAIDLLPDVRVIALLRDPVERAYSHYWHNRRLGTESLSFPEALAMEAERIGRALEEIEKRPEMPTPKSLLRYSYLERSRYAKHLEPWLERVPRDRFLVVRSEAFYKDTDQVFQAILSFLGLKAWSPGTFENFSYAEQRPVIPPMPADSRRWLEGELTAEIERVKEICATAGDPFGGWSELSWR